MTLASRIHWHLRWWKEKYILRVAPREANPFPTHLPVLLALARWLPVRQVLEFGCGDFSTMTFLNRRLFPSVERVVSVENDPVWAEKILAKAAGDPRLDLRVISGPVAASVGTIELDEFDLIFVDDSVVEVERARTIAAVAAAKSARPVVAIHDFEDVRYQRAAREFRNCFRVTGISPNVGLGWNHNRVDVAALRKLNRQLRNVRRTFDTADAPSWTVWLDEEVGARLRPGNSLI
jgi:hypothetical protein